MKKTLVSLMLLALVVGLVGAGTIAYYYDTETSGKNTFASGTLNLLVDGKDDPDVATHSFENIAPGDGENITFVLENAGSIDGVLDFEVVVNNAGGANPESETDENSTEDGFQDNGVLGDNLWIVVTNHCEVVGPTPIFEGTLNDFEGIHNEDLSLAAGDTIDFKIDWSFDKDGEGALGEDVDNTVQGDTADFSITFTLDQEV